jgi:hypothetical protein
MAFSFQLPLQRLERALDSFPYKPALAVGDRINLLEALRGSRRRIGAGPAGRF